MESEEEEVKDFFLKKTNQPVSSAKGANPKGHCCREQREGKHPCSDAAEMPQELEQGSHQGYVVLVWVGVAQGSMIHNQGPGEGYEAAGDRDGKEGELEVGIHPHADVHRILRFPRRMFRPASVSLHWENL